MCVTLTGLSLAQSGPPRCLNSALPTETVAVQVDWDALPQNPAPTGTGPVNDVQPEMRSKRMFGLVANNKTVDPDEHPGPLTVGQKFRLSQDYFGPFTVMFVALSAGYDQAIDAKSGYGQGWEGYGKRYGADFASGLTHTFFVTSAFPALLHQDPRYFRKGAGSASSRLGYSLSSVIITRQDSGQRVFNASEVLGSTVSSGIAHFYYPEEDRTASGFVIRAGLQIAVEAGFNAMREFYPDFSRKLFRRK